MEFIRHPGPPLCYSGGSDGTVRVTLPRWGRGGMQSCCRQQRPWIERQKARARKHCAAAHIRSGGSEGAPPQAARELPASCYVLAERHGVTHRE